jgi:hypothetical protein
LEGKKISKPNLSPHENVEQIAFVNYLDSQGLKFFSVPNGGLRNVKVAVKLKKEGARAGVPDLIILAKSKTGKFNALFLEMKRQKQGSVSPEQKKWHEWLTLNGYCVAVSKGCKQAIQDLEKYLTEI